MSQIEAGETKTNMSTPQICHEKCFAYLEWTGSSELSTHAGMTNCSRKSFNLSDSHKICIKFQAVISSLTN